jgi:hypothetical protein
LSSRPYPELLSDGPRLRSHVSDEKGNSILQLSQMHPSPSAEQPIRTTTRFAQPHSLSKMSPIFDSPLPQSARRPPFLIDPLALLQEETSEDSEGKLN